MKPPSEEFETDRDSPKPNKLRRRLWTVLGLGLIGFAIWCYSAFDPARWAYKGYYHAVVAIVQIDPEIVNRPIDGGWTLLYAAAYGDHPEIVEFLIESGADPDLPIGGGKGKYATRPVHAAAHEGSVRAMKALAAGGADLNAMNDFFAESPIVIAASNGHLDVVRLLLDAGVDPNSHSWRHDSRDGELEPSIWAIEWAAIHGHADVVELLIERGAKVKYVQDDIKTNAFDTFCSHTPHPKKEQERYDEWFAGMPKIIDAMVKELGDVNYRDHPRDDTPLHEAAGNLVPSSVDIIHYLVEHYPDLDVNAKSGSEKTPLHGAMVHPKQLHNVKYLVENCPDLDVNSTDEFQHTPLHEGARSGNAAAVKYLLENCPTLNVNAATEHGMTPLNEAAGALRDAKRENRQEKVEALTKIIELLKAHGGKYGEYRI